ncbi:MULTISPECIES: tyrosine-type recombinase/integrase [Hyphomicrobiales]|uniref:tyrosine-type recombinase/integrase n=1 Tax=Hyphomicrobiales TaxID=356 RepID=UPI001BD0770D|nr:MULTISPECIES: tyrosine-type recombinase/integrase [Hyphomicrobiales]CAH1662676.1 Integrase [Hyphomicrobiales bacterium]MBS7743632.1 tyrosine-type recombinase/integrase [Chelatococcus sp. HY11]MBX3546465.1 tyrosine-type recombinase/integrase [Chelatococcus sp.]MCO5079697.1 tyrosine-type recombinase/integrase [Chelatococcus sp.]MCO5153800.1 tyrosine-type recombinase/integrase [Shinella sp.]
MDDIVKGRSLNAESRRALELDTLSAILPMDRRDRLAQLLTDDDVATLKHLAREGMGENSLRALASDLAYLEGWAAAATGGPLPWPATEALALKFVAHHLWDLAQRETDPRHGMPAAVAEALRGEGLLRSAGPHAPSTVKRRLASWGTLHRWKGIEGPFGSPAVRSAVRLAVRASPRPRRRKSKRAVTRDVLDRLAATCATDRLADTRDLAILLLAFASGGRRRSEVARLRIEQLSEEPAVPLDPLDPNSATLPCISIQLGRTKTGDADDVGRVFLVGPPVEALREWLDRADIRKGAIFRAIDRWEAIEERALTPQSINLIVKRRCTMAELDPKEFAAHGLRAGYLTEAARQGIGLPEAMQQSQHRSVQQAASYYNEAERAQGRAARLGI